MFGRYFKAKAQRLGKERLAWWDLWAPTGSSGHTYTYDEAQDFILTNFASFSPELRDFAQRAFDQQWIDAEQRDGKQGGGFCMDLPLVQESRILCNFDDSLDQVSTIAHELGHAFHSDCSLCRWQDRAPIHHAHDAGRDCVHPLRDCRHGRRVLAQTQEPQEALFIIDTMLIGAAQVIVDIYSRYLFEQEVFERRAQAELSADDFCAIMRRAQLAAYGDGLDERYLHPYMWTWKPHYYSAQNPFYNFPYAFGLLFSTGLYAIYQERGAAFVPDYKALLASTGEGTAAELAARFGIDIRNRAFWDASLAVIGRRIERYCEIG